MVLHVSAIAAAAAAAARRRARARAAATARETMKLMMVLLPTGLLLMTLGGLRGHRTQPDGAQPYRIGPPNSVLDRSFVRACRLCLSGGIKQFIS